MRYFYINSWGALLLLIVTSFGCKQSDYTELDKNILTEIVIYGDLPRNNAVIYYDSIKYKPKALLIFVHGGGWCQGGYNIWLRPDLIHFLLNSDIQLVGINYSLSPFPYQIDNDKRIKHPDHIRDVAKAINYFHQNADKYGVDITRIFLMGHSSGAHLVSLLATNEKYIKEVGLDLSDIAGVIALDGGAYLTNNEQLLFPDDDDSLIEQQFKDLKYVYYNAFTNDPKVHFDACPYEHIEKGKRIPPFLLISQGEDVPYRYIPNQEMLSKLNENGIKTTYTPAVRYEHSVIMNCIGTASDKIGIGSAIVSFVNTH